jgi:TadE-like protein
VSRRTRLQRGQGLVEFAFLLPVFLILLLGMLEFGLAFTHNLTLEYATREGARVGSALVNGGGQLGCASGQSPNGADVDPLIIAAVERVLTSPGSAITIANIPSIRIYKSTASGSEAGPVNVWTLTPGTGPVPPGGTQPLNFSPTSTGWQACSRTNSTASPGPDSIGVSLVYSYNFTTGLKAISRFFGGGGIGPTIQMADKTVMSLNPTNQ